LKDIHPTFKNSKSANIKEVSCIAMDTKKKKKNLIRKKVSYLGSNTSILREDMVVVL
jgi:hypothetical protein